MPRSLCALGAIALLVAGCPKSAPTKTAADAGPTCAAGLLADRDGNCVECLTGANCPAGTFCDSSNATCTSCAQSAASCAATDGGSGSSNGSCAQNSDCPSGKYCQSYVCTAGCNVNSDCSSTQYCNEAHQCATGCQTDSSCTGAQAGLTCCSGTCTDTATNPAANCGGCGKPACATTDNACCNGACSDTSNDPNNCGSCGNACGGSITCVGGNCQSGYAVLGLFDVQGSVSIAADGGSSTQEEILTPFVSIVPGTFNYQSLLSTPCTAMHFDANTPPPASLNAGALTITGYDGGTLASGTAAASEIQCALVSGEYVCGYGALDGAGNPGLAPGESPFPFAATPSPMGAGPITFASPSGGASFGSFSLSASVAASTGYGVTGDLSQLHYSPSADTTIPLSCPAAGCGTGGYFAVLQATSNSAAHFEEPAVAGGAIVCMGGFGTILGVSLGNAQVTFSASDIATMLGTESSSITTFATTVVVLPESVLMSLASGSGKDSEGHEIIAVAGPGSFGLSAQQ